MLFVVSVLVVVIFSMFSLFFWYYSCCYSSSCASFWFSVGHRVGAHGSVLERNRSRVVLESVCVRVLVCLSSLYLSTYLLYCGGSGSGSGCGCCSGCTPRCAWMPCSRSLDSVFSGGSPAPEATSAAELSAANAPNGLFFQDKDLERVSVVASGSGPGVGGLTVEGFRCPVGGCPQPLPVVGNITVAHWSDPRTWEERYCEDSDLGIVKKCTDSDAPAGCACAKPVAGESVYIPEGLHLYLDESTPLLESLLVDGHLEFDENVPGLKELNAKRIMIRRSEDGASATCVLNPQDNKEYCRNFLGAITAGTPESRFGSNATVVPAPVARIRLHGDFDDEPLRLASEYDLGPKVLANFGKLALHGSHRPIVWAKLAEVTRSFVRWGVVAKCRAH